MLESGERVLGHRVNHCSTDAWVKVFFAIEAPSLPGAYPCVEERERESKRNICVSKRRERESRPLHGLNLDA